MDKLSYTMNINNCIDCPHHEVVADPDPHDWFCDDDVAVLCAFPESTEKRCITVACRPYNTRKECDIPEWCPMLDME